LAPLRRASLNPIAIAWLRLVTFRPELLRNVPRFRRRIVDRTFFDADLPYFAITPPGLVTCKDRAQLRLWKVEVALEAEGGRRAEAKKGEADLPAFARGFGGPP
jgi:hypothetical protein